MNETRAQISRRATAADQTGVEVHQWLVARNLGLASRLVFTTGGAFGDTAAQYLANCGAPRLEKPFDKVAFNRVVSEHIRLVREGGAGSTGLRSEDNERG